MMEIPIEKIKPSTTNPRQEMGDLTELVLSIRARIKDGKRGIIEPIIVKELPDGNYEIVIGMRRYEAGKLAELETLPCLVEEFDSEDAIVAGLIENLQRLDLTWQEESIAFSGLSKTLTYPEIAKKVGKGVGYVNHRMAALPLVSYPGVRELELTTAERIAACPQKDWKFLISKVLSENLTRRQLEKIIGQARKIENMIDVIEDENDREKAKSQIEPIIYEISRSVARDIISQIMGIFVPTPDILKALQPLLKKAQQFFENFPDHSEYKEWEENNLLYYQFKGWITKETLEV